MLGKEISVESVAVAVGVDPGSRRKDLAALQTMGNALGPFDHWFVVFRNGRSMPAPSASGRLCVVATYDGRVLVRHVGAIGMTTTGLSLEREPNLSTALARAEPVLAISPPANP
jgi:hypothetical protein